MKVCLPAKEVSHPLIQYQTALYLVPLWVDELQLVVVIFSQTSACMSCGVTALGEPLMARTTG